ncbi:MAG TPA: PHB depolymerase family esterase [Gemmatimonadota bacterium]|nr:PHB depolymerase family esterase [Gemmatimonadota bacterium]
MTTIADSSAVVREPCRFAGLLLVLATALVPGCDSGSGGPVAPTPDPIPGPGDFTRTIFSGGLQRSYLLHVPSGWTADSKLPLVLAFHGVQSDPVHLRNVSGLDDVADRSGVVIAYPAAALGDWNTGCLQCGSNAVVEEIDDLGFVSDLVEQLAADAGIDRRRVYVIGISNGALFVHRLACAAQGIVAAAASVAATLIAPEYVPACGGGTLPMLFFHGSDDTFFPPEGRFAGNTVLSVRLLSIGESVDSWADRDGCEGTPRITALPDAEEDGTTVVRTAHADCEAGAVVVYYAVAGGGHTWPGSRVPSGAPLGRTSRDVSASAVAVDFFLDHSR